MKPTQGLALATAQVGNNGVLSEISVSYTEEAQPGEYLLCSFPPETEAETE
jgi:hypothetical protein